MTEEPRLVSSHLDRTEVKRTENHHTAIASLGFDSVRHSFKT